MTEQTGHKNLQQTYQVRLAWGMKGLRELASAEIVVIVSAFGEAAELATAAAINGSTVFVASLRNRTATAKAIVEKQLEQGTRTAINLVLAGDGGRFAVEDYLAAGAIGDALTDLGLDHSAPDLAVATEGFRALRRALKHLLSASERGQRLKNAGRAAEVKAAAELDVEDEARQHG